MSKKDAGPATIVRSESVAVGKIKLHPDNARRGDIQRIERSLRAHGQYRPIVVHEDTGYILAGNHTYRAAVDRLGWTHIEASFVRCSEAKARAILAVDNRSADDATYDDEALLTLLDTLQGDGLLLDSGYDQADIDFLTSGISGGGPVQGRTDPDEAPPVRAETVSRVGDVWSLGEHRLAVGDATDPLVWDSLLGDRRADLIWTDPPYGVSIVGGDHALSSAERRRRGGKEIVNDTLKGAALDALLRTVFTVGLGHCRVGAAWYVTAPPGPHFREFSAVLGDLGIWRQTLMWVKDTFVMGRSDYHYRHEPILYGWAPGGPHHKVSDRTQDTLHEVARPRASREHPTMKPVELIGRHLLNSSDVGELVVDPFAGSGSTLVAAHRHRRVAALIELDRGYADVICRRFQQHTGVMPTRDGEPVDFAGDALVGPLL